MSDLFQYACGAAVLVWIGTTALLVAALRSQRRRK